MGRGCSQRREQEEESQTFRSKHVPDMPEKGEKKKGQLGN